VPLDALLTLLWGAELAHLAFPNLISPDYLAPGLVLYVLLGLMGSRWQTLALIGALAATSTGLCLAFGAWASIFDGLRKAHIFLAFLPTVMLIRATMDQRPEIAVARKLFSSLDQKERGAGLLFGCHALGSVLSVGIFALLAPILGPHAPEEERKYVVGVGLRGMCLASVWSPFFVSLALASAHLPDVPLWQIMPLGLAFAAVGLMMSYMMFERATGIASLARSLSSLAPVVPMIVVAAILVALVSGLTPLSTLEALVVSIPPLCIVSLLPQGRKGLATACRGTYTGLGNVSAEIGILTLSIILGAVFEASLGPSGLIDHLTFLGDSPLVAIAITMAAITGTGMLGIHPIVSATMLLVVFANVPHGVADLALMQTILIGWGLAAMISISGISVVISSALFSIPPERLIRGQNVLFVIAFGSLSVIILGILNSDLPG